MCDLANLYLVAITCTLDVNYAELDMGSSASTDGNSLDPALPFESSAAEIEMCIIERDTGS